MEGLPRDSYSHTIRVGGKGIGRRKIELKKIVPVEMLQKEMDTEGSGIMKHENRIIHTKCA